ncbi:MAG: hypothetical protein IJA08_07835 [Clostridia bacterium]|nr:hypothetical protein [Clostridia bacterium]
MAKRGRRPLSGGKKALLTLGVIALLVLLFFLSYWITTVSLRAGRDDSPAPVQPTATGSPAPAVNYEALSKAELIELLKERDERIRELEGGTTSAIVDIAGTPAPTQKPIESATPKPTEKATATPKPTVTPKPTEKATATPKPTEKATATPKPTATAKPTQAPTAVPTPTPTPAPTKTPTSIRPVAPAA